MAWFDLSLEELTSYRISTPEPEGFDAWWQGRLAAARAAQWPTQLTRTAEAELAPYEVFDVTFSGDGGDPIRAWYLRPGRGPEFSAEDELPLVVHFVGYGGGRGVPSDHMLLPALGYALFVMDTRGQGATWGRGDTGDPGRAPYGPEFPGVMTRGILDKDSYYFSRLFIDAARAVEVATALPGIDRTRVATVGMSQGGALALVAAALVPETVSLCQADVPFLCDIQRAITLTDARPFAEIASYLAQQPDLVAPVRETLRWVDVALLARRVRARTLFAAALMDQICPPSTVFAAYHEVRGEKEITVHEFSGHITPSVFAAQRLAHLRQHLPSIRPERP